jgi:hypothetical protein
MVRRTTSQRSVATAERREQVVQLKRTKLSFAEIGRRLGISGQRAGQLYKEALAQIPWMAVEEHRLEALELYDTAIHQLMKIAMATTTAPKIKVDAWVAIKGYEDRRAKLLGTDAPARHEVITLDLIDAEIRALESALAHGDQTGEAAAASGVDG